MDLEDPVPPIIPTVAPDGMCRFTSARAYASADAEYLKLTFSKSTDPSGILSTGSAAAFISGTSSSTSTMRRMDSADMVSMT